MASARNTSGAAIAGLSTLLWSLAASGAGNGLDAIERVVHESCECAARQVNGLSAVVTCRRGPQQFGALKAEHRQGWSEDEAQLAEGLERVIETCIASTLDYASARERLGMPPSRLVANRARGWKPVSPSSLADYRTQLVRIDRADGAELKGMVESLGHDHVLLRRSAIDGGGVARIAIAQIRGAWVLQLSAP